MRFMEVLRSRVYGKDSSLIFISFFRVSYPQVVLIPYKTYRIGFVSNFFVFFYLFVLFAFFVRLTTKGTLTNYKSQYAFCISYSFECSQCNVVQYLNVDLSRFVPKCFMITIITGSPNFRNFLCVKLYFIHTIRERYPKRLKEKRFKSFDATHDLQFNHDSFDPFYPCINLFYNKVKNSIHFHLFFDFISNFLFVYFHIIRVFLFYFNSSFRRICTTRNLALIFDNFSQSN